VYITCWTLPLVVTLLPLSTNTYGVAESDSWCFIVDNKHSPSWGSVFWRVFAFYFWIFLSVLIMVYFNILISKIVSHMKSQSKLLSAYSTTALSKIKYYPMVIILCWIISALSDLAIGLAEFTDRFFLILAYMFGLLPGFFCAIIFTINNPEVITRFKKKIVLYLNISSSSRPSNLEDESMVLEACRKAFHDDEDAPCHEFTYY
jgi:hypothetical protein